MKPNYIKKIAVLNLLLITIYSNSYAQDDWFVSPGFEVIHPFSEGIALVQGKAGKMSQKRKFWGAINKEGELLWVLPENLSFVEDNYQEIGFKEGLVTVKDVATDLRGYLNTKGKLVIPCQFHAAGSFQEDLAWIQDEDYKFGFINTKGKLVIQAQYEDSGNFSQGVCAVAEMVDEENYVLKWGYIDTKGEVVIPFRESYYAYPFQENGLAFFNFIGKTTEGVSIDGNSQIIDKKGKIVNPFLSYLAYDFNEDGLLAVTKKVPYEWEEGYQGFITKVGFANEKGELIIDYQFDTYGPMDAPPVFSEGLGLVGEIQNVEYSNMKYGYINTEGEVIIDFQYDVAMPFHNGLAQVTNYSENYETENTYFINTQGEKVIAFPTEYGVSYYFQGFENGYCIVEKYDESNTYNLIDTSGNFVFDRWHEYIQFLGEDLVACRIKGLLGIKKLP